MGAREDALRDLPVLRHSLTDLVALAERMLSSPIPIGSRSHARFMSAIFAAKQLEHARSVLLLEPSMDTMLIVRSMLEGLAQLLWAMKVPRQRPLMWRSFAFVVDWRTLQEQRSKGLAVNTRVERNTRKALRRYGKLFLTKEAKQAQAANKALPSDPYRRNWYVEKESEIQRAVGGHQLLVGVYAPSSERITGELA